MTASRASRVRAWAVRSQVLSLLKASSMGVKTGRTGRQIQQAGPVQAQHPRALQTSIKPTGRSR